MALRVYNTLSRHLEEFKPIKEGQVGLYVCGLTVYDHMHIGHARTYIAFDVIVRYLRYRGYAVNYVQNVTDVDDKIVKRANERGINPLELSRAYAETSLEDASRLGLLKADAYPKVSENIPEIIAVVRALVKNRHAYVAGGDVYFDVSAFPDYGKLSNQNPERLSEHRIEHNPQKKTPIDFSLWKKSEEGELGFKSPWGYGRPGWHIECSAMSRKHLGDQFDIHGGALDLIFPHHENEIAQSESLTGKKPFVKYWLHTGFLYSSGEKMSKSLGNIISVREFLKKHSAGAFRLFVLMTHYRSPLDYSEDKIVNAEGALRRLRNFRAELRAYLSKANREGSYTVQRISGELKEDFVRYLNDDFNTPEAVAAVFEAVKKINSVLTSGESAASLERALSVFDELMVVLGLDGVFSEDGLTEEETRFVRERSMHRAEKNWVEADRVRNMLLERGIMLVDKSDGTTVAERVR